MLNLNFVTPKGTFLRETASYELSCVKNGSVVFPVEDGKKKKEKEGKERHKKSRKRHRPISPILWGSPLQTYFHQILHIRRYAGRNHLCRFWCEKLRGLGYTGPNRGSNFGVSH